MVEDEKKRYRPTKNYLEHLPSLNLNAFETEVMRCEFERVAARQPMDTLSMKRYELPPPPPGKMTDVAAWGECVDNSMAQLEHQATRIMNLELMNEFGSEAWKAHNNVLQHMLTRSQAQLQECKKEIQELNWSRKSMQTKAGEELRHLESSWVSLVSRNYEIEQACVLLEAEIAKFEREKESQEQVAPRPMKVGNSGGGHVPEDNADDEDDEDMDDDDDDDEIDKRK
nr:pre-mRNA-splicing factor SPF27-like isoform X2 [Procambarus clarkii]